MNAELNQPSRKQTDSFAENPAEHEEAPTDSATEEDTDDLDLDLEELGDSDRLKEGFTGQER